MESASGADAKAKRGPPMRSGVESPELVPDAKMARNGADLLLAATMAAEAKLSGKESAQRPKQSYSERQLSAKAARSARGLLL